MCSYIVHQDDCRMGLDSLGVQEDILTEVFRYFTAVIYFVYHFSKLKSFKAVIISIVYRVRFLCFPSFYLRLCYTVLMSSRFDSFVVME